MPFELPLETTDLKLNHIMALLNISTKYLEWVHRKEFYMRLNFDVFTIFLIHLCFSEKSEDGCEEIHI